MNDVNREIAEKVMEGVILSDWSLWLANRSHNKPIANWNPMYRIEHAWMVVEKLNKMPLRFVSVEYIMVQYDYLWKATFWNGMNHIEARGNTAQEAICLAALKAKEVENE